MPEYGFEIRRADGSLALSTRETVLRLVHVETVSADFNGSFSVPDFDAIQDGSEFTGKGFFYVQQRVLPYSQSFGVAIQTNTALGAEILPSLNWSNSNKTMTVVPAAIPSGWIPNLRTEYDIIFMHFR